MELNRTIAYLEYLQNDPMALDNLLSHLAIENIEIISLSKKLDALAENGLYIPIISILIENRPNAIVSYAFIKYIFNLIIKDIETRGENSICKDLNRYLMEMPKKTPNNCNQKKEEV